MSPWPFRRREDLTTGGREARERAEKSLEKTRSETEWFAALGRDLQRIREHNHLADAFLHIAGGGK